MKEERKRRAKIKLKVKKAIIAPSAADKPEKICNEKRWDLSLRGKPQHWFYFQKTFVKGYR
jgi:hypothetical protein